MTYEICGDNRFEVIAKYKAKLIEGTNIETSPDEMAVIDNILFRFWQMGWLDAIEKQIPKKPTHTYKRLGLTVEGCCPVCGEPVVFGNRCSNNDCGQAIDWSDE